MSLRERVLTTLGIIIAAGLVIYPLAYRLSTEGRPADGVEPTAPVMSMAAAATATGTPLVTVRPRVTPRPLEPNSSPSYTGWAADAVTHRGENGSRFEYECPPGGAFGRIWGSGTYTDDSSVCTAAVHRGIISRERGGTVTIIIRPPLKAYKSATRHGVASEAWGPWEGSFRFIDP